MFVAVCGAKGLTNWAKKGLTVFAATSESCHWKRIGLVSTLHTKEAAEAGYYYIATGEVWK